MAQLTATGYEWLSLLLACCETARGGNAVWLSLPAGKEGGAAALAPRLGKEWGLSAEVRRSQSHLMVRLKPPRPAAGSRPPAR